MTKFTSLIPALLRDRFKAINRIIVLMLIAIVVTEVYVFFQAGTDNLGTSLMTYTILWSSVASFIVFIRLSMFNENVYQNDSIRLIPASDTKVYLGSLCTTVIGLLYFMVVQFVLRLVVSLIAGNSITDLIGQIFSGDGMSSGQSIGIILISLGIALVAIVMVWTTISLIHLIMLSIDAFLPIGRQRIIRGILYVVISLAIIRLGAAFFNIYGTLMNGLSLGWGAAFSILGVLVLVVVVESLANVLLMNKFVETAQ